MKSSPPSGLERAEVERRLVEALRSRAAGPVRYQPFTIESSSAARARSRWVWVTGSAGALAAAAAVIAFVWSPGSGSGSRTELPALQLVANSPPTSSVPDDWDREPYAARQWSEEATPIRGAAGGRQWAVQPWVSTGDRHDVMCIEEASTRARQCQTTLVLNERGSTGVLSVGPTLQGPSDSLLLPVVAGAEVTEVRIAYDDGTVEALRATPVGDGVAAVMAVGVVPEHVSSATVTWFTPDGPTGTRYLRLRMAPATVSGLGA